MSSILSQALDLPEAQRSGFLADAIRQAPELGSEVFALYEEMGRTEGFLEKPAVSGLDIHARLDAMFAVPGGLDGGAALAAPLTPARLAPGAALGPYRIEGLIGAGGMGEVYRARDERLDRDVAVKILSEQVGTDPGLKWRLEVEARALATLCHPHICSVFDVGQDGDLAFIVMQYVEGTRLSELVRGEGLPLETLLSYGVQIADALAHAHAHGIVHRDVKGANVMVTAAGEVKVLDFSLARRLDVRRPASALRTLDLVTDPGSVMGTPAYMAPEQLRGEPADARTDIWALGVVLYEMAARTRPFRGDTPFALGAGILNDPPAALPDHVPPELRSVIFRCLAKDPAGRYARVAQVREALEAIAAGQAAPGTWRERRGPGRWALGLALAVALFALVGALDLSAVREGLATSPLWRGLTSRSAAPVLQGVAVLPLRNLSDDPEQEYFTDGMTEALITDLAKIRGLKVIARSSAMRYKQTSKPLADVARELGVDAVVEGSCQRVGQRVIIMIQLINPATERAVWGETYDRDFTDVLPLQSQVAQEIASAIGAAVTPEERERLIARRPVAGDALEAYLRGLYHLQRFTPQDFEISLRHFEAALKIDPDYAAAHAGVAQVWSGRMQAGLVPPREAGPRSLAAASRALELDGALSEAHMALAQLRTRYEWNWEGGEEEFERSIELNPSNAQARIFFSHLLTLVGRPDQGYRQAQHALELDPLNAMCQVLSGVQLLMAGRLDDGIARIRATHEKTPGFGFGHVPLWGALHEQGRRNEALSAAKEHFARARGESDVVEALVSGNAAGGYEEALRRAAAVLEARPRSRHVPPVNMVQLYDKLGQVEQALIWLERGYAERDPSMPYIAVMPLSGELRADPRFRNMLRRMKLPDWQRRAVRTS